MTRRRRASALLVVSLVVLSAGCSDDEGTPSGSPDDRGTTTSALRSTTTTTPEVTTTTSPPAKPFRETALDDARALRTLWSADGADDVGEPMDVVAPLLGLPVTIPSIGGSSLAAFRVDVEREPETEEWLVTWSVSLRTDASLEEVRAHYTPLVDDLQWTYSHDVTSETSYGTSVGMFFTPDGEDTSLMDPTIEGEWGVLTVTHDGGLTTLGEGDVPGVNIEFTRHVPGDGVPVVSPFVSGFTVEVPGAAELEPAAVTVTASQYVAGRGLTLSFDASWEVPADAHAALVDHLADPASYSSDFVLGSYVGDTLFEGTPRVDGERVTTDLLYGADELAAQLFLEPASNGAATGTLSFNVRLDSPDAADDGDITVVTS